MLGTQTKEIEEFERHCKRFARLLSLKMAEGATYQKNGNKVLLEADGKVLGFPASVLSLMKRKSHVRTSEEKVWLLEEGLAELKKKMGVPQSVTIKEHMDFEAESHHAKAGFNRSESPLYRLYSRKSKLGKAYITEAHFLAGEKLRADFERGQLQPRVTASYEIRTSGNSRRAVSGEQADISDFAIDARARVNKAIGVLGPELSGVALDICCFLKGFESVERERGWPPRSGKLMLRTALSVLAVHYGFDQPQINHADCGIRNWMEEGSRPAIA